MIPASGQPIGGVVGLSDTLASLTVSATVINGNTNQQLSYQWQSNGVSIASATKASFTPLLNSTGATYRVVVSYPGATNVTSAPALLTIVPDLVLHFAFPAPPVNNVVVDSSGASHNGSDVNGSVTWIASDAGHSNVMSFDGSIPSEITVAPHPDFLAMRGAITFWMKSSNVLTTPNQYAAVVDHRAQTADNLSTTGGDVIYQAPTGELSVQAQAHGTGANGFSTAANPTDGKWHHIAYIYDQAPSGSISVYIDGVLDTRKPNSIPWSWVQGQELEIGASHDPFWTGFNGELADFRVYTHMLTASEIGALAGLGPQPHISIPVAGQPKGGVVGASDTLAALSVNATVLNGNTNQHLSYQWQINGTNITGATNSTYAPNLKSTNIANQAFTVVLGYPGATNVTSAPATLQVVPDFVLHFDFTNAPVNGVVVDSSGAGNNGTDVNGSAKWVPSDAGRTNVLSFDGSVPTEIIVPTNLDFLSMRGTIAFWMKSPLVTPTPNPYAMIFDHRAMPADNLPVSGGDVIYQSPNGHLSIQTEITARGRVNQFTTVANPTDNKWHHIAYVYDQSAAGFITMYIDGIQDTRRSNTGAWVWSPQEEIEIGASHDTFWSGYGGELGDLRIYTRILNPSEIAQLAGVAVAPNLKFTLSGKALTLTWDQTGYVLQQNTDLANAKGWVNVTGGNISPFNITIGQTGNIFYRLLKP